MIVDLASRSNKKQIDHRGYPETLIFLFIYLSRQSAAPT